MLGLRWQDIGFEAGHFTPVKQVQRVKGVGLVLKDLKTESSQAGTGSRRLTMKGAPQGRSGDPPAQPDQHVHGRLHELLEDPLIG
ncbi:MULTISPECIES: hypothetical protein [Streptomyces]|uniref:Uncharacterized protein n=1 Tax=Streptomyces bangladeshensis TaxID=295352 RepID=A0ABN3BC54_9ACTN|nr:MULTISPECIES: hypothetical protein [unclassified Streptomyces]MCE0445868.1 hypothetical protein [Streptomyces tricolor]BCM68056.1 hypothetical protein EASAB2608_03390 [Streptomyces sp. EAS-AB2608]